HLAPVGHARLPILVGVELARETVLVKVTAILSQLLLGQSLRSGYPVAVYPALESAGAAPMLDGVDLRLRPVLDETATENAAMMGHIGIERGGPPPDGGGGRVLGLQPRRLPLILGIVGNAIETDFTVGPRLHACPFDA